MKFLSIINKMIIDDNLNAYRAIVTTPESDLYISTCLLSYKTNKIGRFVRAHIFQSADWNNADRTWVQKVDDAYALLGRDWSQLPAADLSKHVEYLKLILIAQNDKEKLTRLYQLTNTPLASVDIKMKWYQQSALLAVSFIRLDCLKIIKAYEPSAFKQVCGEYNVNCLFLAAQDGEKEIVEWLLDSGIENIKMPSTAGMSALHVAADKNNIEVVELLLRKGGEVMKRPQIDGANALMTAAAAGHEKVVKMLLDAGGFNLEQIDATGWTPLEAAAQSGRKKIVDLFLKQDADLIKKSKSHNVSPLLSAVVGGNIEIMELLIQEGGEEILRPKHNGETALHYAADRGNLDAVHLLLAKGGAAMKKSSNLGISALNVAVRNRFFSVAQVLIAKGGDEMRKQDKAGWNALHIAAEIGDKAMVALLLKHCGGMLHQKLNNDMTVLQVAEQNHHDEVVQVLKKALLNSNQGDKKVGAECTQSCENKTCQKQEEDPSIIVYNAALKGELNTVAACQDSFSSITGLNALHVALMRGDGKTAGILLAHRLSPDTPTRDAHGLTPLMLAIKHHCAIVESLLDYCTNLNAVSANGITAVGLAAKEKSIVITRLLLEKFCDLGAALGQDKESTQFLLTRVYDRINCKNTQGSECEKKWLEEIVESIHFDNQQWFVINKLNNLSPLMQGLPRQQFIEYYFRVLFVKLSVNLFWHSIAEYQFQITGEQSHHDSVVGFFDFFQKTIKPLITKQPGKAKFNQKLLDGERVTLSLEFDNRAFSCFVNYFAQNDCLPHFKQTIKPHAKETEDRDISDNHRFISSGTLTRPLSKQEMSTIINLMKKVSAGCKIHFSHDPETMDNELNVNYFEVNIDYANGFVASRNRYEFNTGKMLGIFSANDLDLLMTRLKSMGIHVYFNNRSHLVTATFNANSVLDSQCWNRKVFEFFNKHFSKKGATSSSSDSTGVEYQSASTASRFPMWTSTSSTSVIADPTVGQQILNHSSN